MKPEILADLAHITLEKVYPRSENIFEKGDEGSSLYIIVEGAVRIHDASDSNKVSKTLAVLKEGEFFGELSILDNETRSASATAQDDSILLEIGQHSFQRLMVENFELSQNLLASLAHRIRNLTEKIQKDS